jgi:hypothetical protein
VAETPEPYLLLDRLDVVVPSSLDDGDLLRASVWSFRRNERTVQWLRAWCDRGKGPAEAALSSPDADEGSEYDEHVVLGGDGGEDASRNPYNVRLDEVSSWLRRDPTGFSDERMGRAKVIHVGELDPKGNASFAGRVEAFIDRYPRAVECLSYYAHLANRAAGRLEMEGVENAANFASEQLIRAGIIPTREQLPMLLNHRGLVGRGVEIGVDEGRFSEHILLSWRGRNLLSVDAWMEGNERYDAVRDRLGVFGERSTVWKATSVQAAERVEDGTLDFAYIDAKHDYDSVMEDLRAWHRKVRPGGILAGHDYIDGDLPDEESRVKSAVDDYFRPLGLTVRSTYQDAPFNSWVVQL